LPTRSTSGDLAYVISINRTVGITSGYGIE
jgi:hypothetical protein